MHCRIRICPRSGTAFARSIVPIPAGCWSTSRTGSGQSCEAIRIIRSPADSFAARSRRYLDREYSPQTLAVSAAPRRRKGRRPLRTDHLGRGHRHHRRPPEADVHEEWGSESILPYSYAGTMGMLNGSGMDRRFFHRLGASRLDRTICSAAGTAGIKAALGARYGTGTRAVPPLQADHRVGREHPRHQRPSLAVHRRGAAQRREVLRHRSGRESHGQAGRQGVPDPSRQRPRAGTGTDARDHRAKICTIENTSTRQQLGSICWPSACKSYTPERVAGLTGIPAEDIVALAREYATTRPARSA